MPRKNRPKSQIPSPLRVLCDDKRRFSTEKQAFEAKEYRELLQLGLELHVYRCTVAGCRGWHLTSHQKE